MKNSFFVSVALVVLAFSTISRGDCPEDPNDHGICDSMYIEPWPADTLLEGEPPYLVRVPIYVTHDVPDPSYDSLAAFVIPLCYTHTNSNKYCSVSTYWNDPNYVYPWPDTLIQRSIFRHFINPADSSDTLVHNRMLTLSQDLSGRVWDTRILQLDDTSYFRLSMIATGYQDQYWWEGSKVLLATMTFTLEDTMQICMDTCFWPPNGRLLWYRSDAVNFVPRLGTPHSPGSYEFCFNIHAAFRAGFSAQPESGFAPLSVQFTDQSTGDPTSWLWDFGDDSTSTDQHPMHAYSDTGHYDVTLITSDGADSDTMTKPQYIVVFDTLSVDFTADPTEGHEPLVVAFRSLCDPVPYEVRWYFGDGDSSVDLNPVHEYTEAGIYGVKLVAHLFDYQDSLTREDYIRVSDIEAEFASDNRCGPAPLTVAFSDSSTGAYTITEWHWDFSDGETSDQQNPTHEFVDIEVFDITLIVSDGIAVDTLTKKGYITTQETVSAEFVGFPTRGPSPLAVMFEPILEGIANQYLWDFGDGETSSLSNPIHIYTAQGEYDVKLVARLELNGCSQADSSIEQEYVMVNDLEAQFSANPTAGIAPLFVQFTDESSGDPDTWFWDFGDGNTSAQQHPSHWYDTTGIYDVFLRVRNFIGADSLLKLTYILVTDSLYTDLFDEIYDPGGARPGFDLWFYCVWTNVGSNPAENCRLKILLPPEMTLYDVFVGDIRTGSYSGYDFSGDTIVVPLGTIDPSDWYGGYIYPYGNLPETVQIGDTLVCESWLTTSTSEQNYSNNHVLHFLEVTGSIDPNDKLAYPEGRGAVHAIEPGQRLEYTIRFENKPEATAEAIYVRVVDTLDQDLDWGSLAIGAASHADPCDYEFNPYTGEIMWFCDSIMLPPNVDPPEGEGYFTFSVSPKPDLPPGTELANTAWIRFDYNDWLQAPEEGPVIRTIKYESVGDANADGIINIGDVVYLINYLYRNGTAPDPVQAGDANYDGVVDIGDVIYLVNYLYRQGPPPRR